MTRETHPAVDAPRRAPRTVARCLLALLPAALAWLAMESLAAGLVRPAEALGLGYLARLSAAVLAAAGLLAGSRRQLVAVAVGALAVVATAWLTPPGLPRGAAVVALLAMVLAGAAAVGLAEARGRRGWSAEGLPLAGSLVVLAVGLQLLCRSPLLLTPGLAESFDPDLASRLPPWLTVRLELLGLPVLGALAVSALVARRGVAAALTAGAAAVLLGGGWTREGVVCLGVLAIVPRPEELDDPARRRRHLLAVALVAAGLSGLALVWTRLATFALLAGLALALSDRPRPPRQIDPRIGGGARLAGLGAVASVAVAAAVVAGIAPWPEAVGRAALVPLAVPLVGLGIVTGGLRRTALGLAALAFAVVGARAVPGTAALAAPAALAACAAFAGPAKAEERETAPGEAFQAAWSGLGLVAVAIAAAYPWRRADPLALLAPDTAAGRWGLALAVAVLAGAVVAVLGTGRRRWRLDGVRVAAALALVAGSVGLALGLPASGTVLLGPGAAAAPTAGGADSGAPATLLERRLDPPRVVREVVVDSFLANAADLAPGTPVATLHLAVDGAPDRAWTLRAGEDTGEWAASRSDLAPARLTTPAPWASWVAPDAATGDPSGPRGFFGQLYRSRTPVEVDGDGARVTGVRLTRRPDLPIDTTLAVRRLELFP